MSIAVVVLAVGVGGYYFGIRRQEVKSKSDAVVTLSPDDVETAEPSSPKSDQQPSPNPEFKNDATPSATRDLFYPATPPANPPDIEQPTAPSPSSKERFAEAHQAPARSLPTGTNCGEATSGQADTIPDGENSSEGELKAVNGTPWDACVVVVDPSSQKRAREVFVKAEESFSMEHLDPGIYDVVFALGKDWDERFMHFNRDATYFEVGKILSFTQDERSSVRHTLTLHTVLDGNVTRKPISEAEFHALSGKP
jgi:hypothetical protein